MASLVYKVLRLDELGSAKTQSQFDGSADDLRDGFIHLSTAGQLAATLARHFAGEERLVLLGFEAEQLGPQLRWETSRGGQRFPHLYGPLDISQAVTTAELRLDGAGLHTLPEGLT